METPITRRSLLVGAAALLATPAMADFVNDPSVAQCGHPSLGGQPHCVFHYSRLLQRRVALVHVAQTYLGKTVGRGECTDFVEAALREGKFWPGQDYQWGTRIDFLAPGVILQTHNARYEGPGGAYRETNTQHTAILVSWDQGRKIGKVIQQNSKSRRFVTVDDIDFNWKLVRGRMEVFHPYG